MSKLAPLYEKISSRRKSHSFKNIRFCCKRSPILPTTKKNKDFCLANQLFKSSTSIGANTQNAESKADFIHKSKIAIKEVDETEYWLALCTELYDHPELVDLSEQLTEIQKIINKIISTSRKT